MKGIVTNLIEEQGLKFEVRSWKTDVIFTPLQASTLGTMQKKLGTVVNNL